MSEYKKSVRQFFSIIVVSQIVAIVVILGLINYGVGTVEMVANQHAPSAPSDIFRACIRPIW